MKHKPVYEQIISHKLAQVPLPDLQEEIWLRIERQLDIDMPTDDNNPEPPDMPPAPDLPNLLYEAGSLVVIAAFVIIFSVNKNHAAKNNAIQNDGSRLPTVHIAPVSRQEQKVVAKQTTLVLTKSQDTISSAYSMQTPQVALFPDSLFSVTPEMSTPIPDLAVQPIQGAAPVLQMLQDTVPQKKARGVKGITDADYRIVVVKDSAKKRN
jgi:hypothetical protein